MSLFLGHTVKYFSNKMGGIKLLTTNKLNSNYRVNSKMEVEFKGREEDLTEEDQEVEDVQDN